ncbi:MAG: LysR family transcriptional regulator [Rhizobiales bacterium]|nr:LysR family transcriptional regulator [Hyphomicrobiales bacterium]OJU30053.1 MAG: LysR family transcriptional regulator [Rhizobiales bacterium 68-8]
MSQPDLNLLLALEALLVEGSVARAARRLRLSPSATSRALARLRASTGDPLLVRAGRSLVPTPRALELRGRVGLLVQEAEAVLAPVKPVNMREVVRTFTLRNRGGFVENFGPALVARVSELAPGLRLVFVPKLEPENTNLLRDGSVDLGTGVVDGASGPELRVQALFRDNHIVVVRPGHPLCTGPLTSERYAAARHVLVADREFDLWPVDDAVEKLGFKRDIAAVVGGFSEALNLVRGTDLVATVPERFTANLRDGLVSSPFPVPLDEFTFSMVWHPRMDADPVHRWLRECVREVCKSIVRGRRLGGEDEADASPEMPADGEPDQTRSGPEAASFDEPAGPATHIAARAG